MGHTSYLTILIVILGIAVVLFQIPSTYIRSFPFLGYAGTVAGFTSSLLLLSGSLSRDAIVDRIIDTYVGVVIFQVVDNLLNAKNTVRITFFFLSSACRFVNKGYMIFCSVCRFINNVQRFPQVLVIPNIIRRFLYYLSSLMQFRMHQLHPPPLSSLHLQEDVILSKMTKMVDTIGQGFQQFTAMRVLLLEHDESEHEGDAPLGDGDGNGNGIDDDMTESNNHHSLLKLLSGLETGSLSSMRTTIEVHTHGIVSCLTLFMDTRLSLLA
jgi:hypothetical protein